MALYDGPVWWPCMMTLYDGPCYLKMNCRVSHRQPCLHPSKPRSFLADLLLTYPPSKPRSELLVSPMERPTPPALTYRLTDLPTYRLTD